MIRNERIITLIVACKNGKIACKSNVKQIKLNISESLEICNKQYCISQINYFLSFFVSVKIAIFSEEEIVNKVKDRIIKLR